MAGNRVPVPLLYLIIIISQCELSNRVAGMYIVVSRLFIFDCADPCFPLF